MEKHRAPKFNQNPLERDLCSVFSLPSASCSFLNLISISNFLLTQPSFLTSNNQRPLFWCSTARCTHLWWPFFGANLILNTWTNLSVFHWHFKMRINARTKSDENYVHSIGKKNITFFKQHWLLAVCQTVVVLEFLDSMLQEHVQSSTTSRNNRLSTVTSDALQLQIKTIK